MVDLFLFSKVFWLFRDQLIRHFYISLPSKAIIKALSLRTSGEAIPM